MKKLTFLLITTFMSIATAHSQENQSSYKRLATAQLDKLIATDAIDSDTPADLHFVFDGCDLNMRVTANGGDAKFNINVVWDMAKSSHVFYEIQDAPNRYEVKLGVPADDINIKLSLGKKLSVNADLDSSDVDDFEELTLETNDRKEVETLVYRLNKIAAGCKGI